MCTPLLERPPSLSTASISTDYSPTLNDTSSEHKESAVTIDPEHPDDTDILVFGFQELDLSTEALIYSTKTTREDAWCAAIFAALGDKASRYEKVGLAHRHSSVHYHGLLHTLPVARLEATRRRSDRDHCKVFSEKLFLECDHFLCRYRIDGRYGK